MKNTLADLNNHLFEQLERLNDDDLKDEQLDTEIKRADAMAKIAGEIIQSADIAYKVMKHCDEYYPDMTKQLPEVLEVKHERISGRS